MKKIATSTFVFFCICSIAQSSEDKIQIFDADAPNIPINHFGPNAVLIIDQDSSFPVNGGGILELSRLEILNGAKLFLEGNTVFLKVKEIVSDNGKMVAYDDKTVPTVPATPNQPGAPGERGADGLAAGSLVLDIQKVTLKPGTAKFIVDLSGTRGGQGGAGSKGYAGASGKAGIAGRAYRARVRNGEQIPGGCFVEATSGKNGDPGGPGGSGGEAGVGGDAGNILIKVGDSNSIPLIETVAKGGGGNVGGKGGEGGDGGNGGKKGPGGDCAPNDISDGNTGPSGVRGIDLSERRSAGGRDGKIVISN